MSARSPLVVAAVLAGALALSGSASAPTRVGVAAQLEALNAIRAQLGLEPLRRNLVADRLVAEIAARDLEDIPPATLDSQPDCAVCSVVFRNGAGVDPRKLYSRRGGKSKIGFGLWRQGWSATTNLSVFFPTAAMALDPRARTFSAAPTPRGMLVVAITVDPRAVFGRPVRWPRGEIDPRRQLWVELVLPPGTRGHPRLLERRSSRSVVVAHPLADTVGVAGARLVAFGLSSVLAYGHRYSVRVGSVSTEVATRPAPVSFLRRSWTFVSLASAERQAFLGLFRSGPALLRRLAREFDGAVDVVGGPRACSVADACERVDADRATIGLRRFESFVVLHEVGHAIFDLGLDEPGRRLFLAAFVRAGWKGECCTPSSEIFADQLAFWALGRVPPGVDSYSETMLLSRGRFTELLRQNAAYRPLSAVGPLER